MQQIESGDRTVVGVNRFQADAEEKYSPLRVDPAIEAEQRAALERLRDRRDAGAVRGALDDLRKAASGADNVLPPMRSALAAEATVGEVCNALRDVWGVYTPADRF
jgi:methylmalonyl-CoA mutase N-terminal domain/subunit